MVEVRVTDSPWFIGVGENLVVRKQALAYAALGSRTD